MLKIYIVDKLEQFKTDLINNGYSVQVVDILDDYNIKVINCDSELVEYFIYLELEHLTDKIILLSDKCLVDKDLLVLQPRR